MSSTEFFPEGAPENEQTWLNVLRTFNLFSEDLKKIRVKQLLQSFRVSAVVTANENPLHEVIRKTKIRSHCAPAPIFLPSSSFKVP